MKRSDLLDILVQQNHKIERLEQELKICNQELANRQIQIDNAGSIADASLALNGIFEAAQAACQQYMDNVKRRSDQQEQICVELERQTKEQCERMLLDAQRQADAYWEQTNQKIQQLLQETEGLRELLSLG